MVRNPYLAVAWTLAILVALILTAANLYLGNLNQDEGWYLYAARMVSEGHIPYRDFAYTQAPVMPFVYAAAQPLVDRWGLAGGRLFTALLGFAAALSAAALAARLVGKGRAAAAGLVAFLLIGVNVYHSYYSTVVKTYSLSGLLLALGFLSMSFADGRRHRAAALLSGVMLGLATGTRVSAAVALPVALAFLLFERRNWKDGWFWLALGGGVAGAGVFLPFLLAARDGFLFGVIEYHTLRSVGTAAEMLAYKSGFVSRLVQAYFVAAGIGVALVLARLFGLVSTPTAPGASPGPARERLARPVWATVAAVTLVHLSAPFPYEDYQVMVFPLFAAALSAAVVRTAPGPRLMHWIVAAVAVLCLASAFSSPVNQEWFVYGRDRIWWRLKEEAPLTKLRRAAQSIRSVAKPGDTLLTQDAYLAVETGLRLPRGLELGPFSYYPDWTTERAERCHVLNAPMLRALLKTTDAPVAALSGYSLSIRSPEVKELAQAEQDELWGLVRQRYAPMAEFRNFGQGATLLRVLARREPEGPPIP